MSHAKIKLVALATAAALVLAPAAQASTISYDFTATVTAGPRTGTVASGSFSYDSSSITPGDINNGAGLLTALAFTFNGINYDASTANTGALEFDKSGGLIGFFFGSDCTAGGCSITGGTNVWSASPGYEGFSYAVADTQNDGWGDVTFAPAPAPVPEPGSLALLAVAILGLGCARLRRRRSACA